MDWIKAYWAPKLTPEEEERFKTEYPNDVTKGSPFDTGSLNQLFGNRQYKRVAAFQDDMIFQAPRRFFTEALSNKTDVWVYRKSLLVHLSGPPVEMTRFRVDYQSLNNSSKPHISVLYVSFNF